MTEADSVLSGAVDSVKPWTIKSVATETRDLMIIAARKEGLTVGQWLDRRARAWSEGEVGPGLPESAPVLALPAPAVSPGPTALEAAAQAVAIVQQLSGIPGLPESVQRSALSLLRHHLLAARRGRPSRLP